MPVVDTDVIARELVQPGQPALDAIVREFGRDVLDESGQLDRRRMRAIVFADSGRRRRLEAILHPAIGAEAERQLHSVGSPYCILVVPLLAESGRYRWADRVLVVDVDEETQITRLMARDGVSREQAESALRAQTSRERRLALADDLIENNGNIRGLNDRVAVLHEKYSELADTRNQTSLP